MTRAVVVHPGPHFSVADVHTGWVRGLKANGVEVLDYNLHDRLNFYDGAFVRRDDGEYVKAFEREAAVMMAIKGLEVACYEFWPDLVIVVSGFFVPPEVVKVLHARNHHLVLLATESPYEDDRQVQQAPRYDTVLLNDPTNLDGYREVQPRTFYMPHAYEPAIHRPAPADPDLVCDVSFVGTGYPSRIEFLEKVDWRDLRVTLGGNWLATGEDSPLRALIPHRLDWCLDNMDAVRLYNASKASFNLYRKEALNPELAEGWAMGPREVEMAACGLFFAREPRGEGDEVLSMLPTFTTPAELGDILAWWCSHDSERDDAARSAMRAVADRTFQRNAAELLRLALG